MTTFFEKIMAEFDKVFPLSKLVNGFEAAGTDWDTEVLSKDLKSFIASSHKRLLDEVIERVNGKKHGYGTGDGYLIDRGYNQALSDIIQYLQSLKEEIK